MRASDKRRLGAGKMGRLNVQETAREPGTIVQRGADAAGRKRLRVSIVLEGACSSPPRSRVFGGFSVSVRHKTRTAAHRVLDEKFCYGISGWGPFCADSAVQAHKNFEVGRFEGHLKDPEGEFQAQMCSSALAAYRLIQRDV